MNKEVRRICEKNGYEINHPRRLENALFEEKIKEINYLMSSFYNAHLQGKLQDQIDAIIDNTYVILDIFANMGIQPDGMLDAFIVNKKDNSTDDDSVKLEIFSLVKKELNMMKNYRYTYSDDSDITRSYAKLRRVFDNNGIPYSQTETKLSKADAGMYLYCGYANVMDRYNHSPDIEEDAYRLTNMLYHNLYVLIQMGVAPEVLQERIVEKIESDTKKR